MPIALTTGEKEIAKKLAEIKDKSGSHSPSPAMLAGIKGVEVKHDFCFLGNPHATDLFLKYWKRDLKKEESLRKLVELYPSQNHALAQRLKHVVGMPAKNIFVGNGATEVIQAVLHNFVARKILVPVPTFSPYLEFAPKGVKTVSHQLRKGVDFKLESARFLKDIRRERPDTVVILNPNNPDGGYIHANELQGLLRKLRTIETVIVDESFIHFVSPVRVSRRESRLSGYVFQSFVSWVKQFPNLVVIKSLSKDFGIAGLRLGYGVMSEKRVSTLLRGGYLWNVSGFGEYFLDLLNNKAFLKEYEKVRLLAIKERDDFFSKLSKIPGLKVYPSKANLFLVELLDGSIAEDLTVALLVRYGMYVRPCSDKVGLEGEFVRIASRKTDENRILLQTLKNTLSE